MPRASASWTALGEGRRGRLRRGCQIQCLTPCQNSVALTRQPIPMAPLALRMALPARPVQMARRTPVRSSRAVRVRANSDELSRIAEIEEEIARQVSWGVVRCSARRLGRFCSRSCWVSAAHSPGADLPLGRTTCLLAPQREQVSAQRSAIARQRQVLETSACTSTPHNKRCAPYPPWWSQPRQASGAAQLHGSGPPAPAGPARASRAGARSGLLAANRHSSDLPVGCLGLLLARAAGGLSLRHSTGTPPPRV